MQDAPRIVNVEEIVGKLEVLGITDCQIRCAALQDQTFLHQCDGGVSQVATIHICACSNPTNEVGSRSQSDFEHTLAGPRNKIGEGGQHVVFLVPSLVDFIEETSPIRFHCRAPAAAADFALPVISDILFGYQINPAHCSLQLLTGCRKSLYSNPKRRLLTRVSYRFTLPGSAFWVSEKHFPGGLLMTTG